MRKTVTSWTALALATCVSAAGGCASAPPQELKDARAALEQARSSPAQDLNPARLHGAESALKLAEATFEAEGDSARTRDRAYVAIRKAQLAQVEARTAQSQTKLSQLEAQFASARTEQLDQLRAATAQQQAELARIEQARKEAEQRAEELSRTLAQVAEVKQDARGTVVTLSGSVLFTSGEAELLPAARARLTRVARTLAERAKDARIVVEGHTDTQGSQEFNLDLSERRAEAVKQFLVEHGVAGDRIEAKGLGFSQPVAPNQTAEGRANNRRVEIVLEPRGGSPAAPSGGAAQEPEPAAGSGRQG